MKTKTSDRERMVGNGNAGPDEKLTELQTEVQKRFGVLPNFFRLCPERPEITKNLWGFAGFAYLDNPLPSLFKERLFVFLSRFCDVRYCIVRHVGFLTGLGRPAGDERCSVQTAEEVVRLLWRPFSRGEHLEKRLSLCVACEAPFAEMPGPDSEMEEAIFDCAGHVFLQTADAPRCLEALRQALGVWRFQYLTVFLAFIRTAHYWTKIHPKLVFEDDINRLLATHEQLAKYLLNDPEGNACEMSQKLLGELAELRSKKMDFAARRLAAIVESSDDAIVFKDLDGIIKSWNKGAERIFGYTAEEAIGKPATILIPQNQLDEEASILARIRRGERVDHYETIRRRKDGQFLHVSLTVSPVTDDEGNIIGVSKIARDISNQKKAELQVAESLERERQANRMKDDFLAMLSHELRTPLNPVLLTASDAAANPQISPEVREQFESILRNVEVEVQLVDDLLDLSRITHGKLKINPQTLDAQKVLLEAIEIVRPDAEKKQIRVATKL